MKKMNKLKAKITIPQLNLTGEMKPIKSNELLKQLEDILIENKLNYRLEISAYRETNKLTGDEKAEIREAAIDNVLVSEEFSELPLSTQALYSALCDVADENGVIPNAIDFLDEIDAELNDLLTLSNKKYIILNGNSIRVFALAMAACEIEYLEGLLN